MTLKWLAAQHLALIYHHSNYSQHIQLDNRHLWYNTNALSKHQQRPGVQNLQELATLLTLGRPWHSFPNQHPAGNAGHGGRPYRGSTGRRLPRHQQLSPKTGKHPSRMPQSLEMQSTTPGHQKHAVTTPRLRRGRRRAPCTRHRISSKRPALMATRESTIQI